MIEYACPECGYDGPHSLGREGGRGVYVVECGDSECGVEFEIPTGGAP